MIAGPLIWYNCGPVLHYNKIVKRCSFSLRVMVCFKNVAASGTKTFPFTSLYFSSLSESRAPLKAKVIFALGTNNAKHLCYITKFSWIFRQQIRIIKVCIIKEYWKCRVHFFLNLQNPKALIDVFPMQAVSLSSGSSPWAPTHVVQL